MPCPRQISEPAEIYQHSQDPFSRRVHAPADISCTLERASAARAQTHAPEQHGVVHPLWHKMPLVLQLLPQFIQRMLLGHGEVAEAPWRGAVVGICDALWHRAGAGGLGGVHVRVLCRVIERWRRAAMFRDATRG